MKYVDEFREAGVINKAAEEIRRLADPGRQYRFMESLRRPHTGHLPLWAKRSSAAEYRTDSWPWLSGLRSAAAARFPVQCAAGFLSQIEESPNLLDAPFHFPARYLASLQLVEKRVRTFETPSMGRLFDTVAALLGFTRAITFEGQAAIWLEQIARAVPPTQPYPFPVTESTLDFRPLLAAVIRDRIRGRDLPEIACIPRGYKCLGTTNVIESPQSGVQKRTHNVTRWRAGEMVVERWVASAWLLTEKHFRKVIGHRDLWALAVVLGRERKPNASSERSRNMKLSRPQPSTTLGTPSLGMRLTSAWPSIGA